MYNGTNTTNPTEPPIAGGLSPYDIILIVGAIFSGIATILGAINCYRQQSQSKELYFSDTKIEVKRIGPKGEVQEASCSIHINDDEGYNVTKSGTIPKKKTQVINSKSLEETKSEEDNSSIIVLAENDTKSDIQRNATNHKLIEHTLEEFHHTVKMVFGHVDQNEITVTGEIESTL